MEKKEFYRQKLEAQIAEWRAEIDLLKAKAHNASVDYKQKYDEKMDLLETKLSENQNRLKELEAAGEEAWDAIKDGAESIWETMKSTMSEVKSKFKD